MVHIISNKTEQELLGRANSLKDLEDRELDPATWTHQRVRPPADAPPSCVAAILRENIHTGRKILSKYDQVDLDRFNDGNMNVMINKGLAQFNQSLQAETLRRKKQRRSREDYLKLFKNGDPNYTSPEARKKLLVQGIGGPKRFWKKFL
jgi:hypothetical protein